MLRHPVVITSLEEDFKKIGLIKEDRRSQYDEDFEESYREKTMGAKDLPKGQGGETGTGSPGKNTHSGGSAADLKMGYKTGGDELTGKQSSPKAKGIDHGTTEDDDEFDDPMEEARAFSEAFETDWEAVGEGDEFDMDEEDMSDLEEMSESIVELPGGVLDEDEGDDDDGDDDEPPANMEAIQRSMQKIEGIVEALQTEGATSEAAIPAFANIALIAEQLVSFFGLAAEEDEDFQEAVEAFTEMAREAAGTVHFLQQEDDAEINFDAVAEAFNGHMSTLLDGLDVYSKLTEGDDKGDDEDDDEGNE
jgi:hypothetical protein